MTIVHLAIKTTLLPGLHPVGSCLSTDRSLRNNPGDIQICEPSLAPGQKNRA